MTLTIEISYSEFYMSLYIPALIVVGLVSFSSLPVVTNLMSEV